MTPPPSPKPPPAMAKLEDDDTTQLLSLLSPDFTPRVRTGTVVTESFGFTSLAPGPPVLNVNLEKNDKSEEQEQLSKTRDLFHNHQAHISADPVTFGLQLGLWASGSGWRSYTDYIGGKIMYEGYTKNTINSLVNSDAVQAKVHELSLKRLDELNLPPGTNREKKLADLERQLKEVVLGVADGLVAKMDSVRFLRGFGALINNLLVRMYHQGIHISLPEYSEFKKAAIVAASKKQSLLLLPCHKSHIDYLTISWLFFRLGLSLPHIVAGENLNMPVVGSALQKCGAFFIRRSFGDDALYPTVVREYVEQLLERGMNIECFIEGSRSRTGKLLPPKLGILKYIVEALENGRVEDVVICPISVQYDKVIETETYINELLGNPKEKETLGGLLLNTRVVQLQLGRIDVRFKKPFSLRSWLDAEKGRRIEKAKTTHSQPKQEQSVLLRALGYQVLSDINSAAVIMPAALVGTVLLTIRGRGVGKAELVQRVGWLRNAIEARGGKVADFAGMEIGEVVDRALIVLKDQISTTKGLIEPVYHPANRFELSFYRNQVIHLFVLESMLCAVLYTHVKAGGPTPAQRMNRGDGPGGVFTELHFLSRLLQSEFVYGVSGLEANAKATIASLERDEVITLEGDMIGLSSKERAGGRNNFDFFNFLIWPYIETYWLAAVSLVCLTPTSDKILQPPVAWVAEKAFHASAQTLGKNLYACGDISYLEAVNQATLANAFQRMVDLGVIITRRSATSKSSPALMALHPSWVPRRLPSGEIEPAGRLWEFLTHLGQFRREGKNRRDNATVSARVFGLCSAIAPVVLEHTEFEGSEKPASDFWATKANL